nr:DUF5131 family protein [Pseudomonas aeruginosa]
MADYFSQRTPPANAWLGARRGPGVRRAQNRLPGGINAAIRFLSAEPLLEDLGELNLTDIHWVIVAASPAPRPGQ